MLRARNFTFCFKVCHVILATPKSSLQEGPAIKRRLYVVLQLPLTNLPPVASFKSVVDIDSSFWTNDSAETHGFDKIMRNHLLK